MNFVRGLLPSVRFVKPEPAAKDTKQQQKQSKQKWDDINENILSEQSEDINEVSPDTFEERRSGENRRAQDSKRDRWVESRIKKDRRATNKVYMKI